MKPDLLSSPKLATILLCLLHELGDSDGFSDSPNGRGPNTGQIGRFFTWSGVALFAESKLSHASRCHSICRHERMVLLPIGARDAYLPKGINWIATSHSGRYPMLIAFSHRDCIHDWEVELNSP
jgi:hypothetical protein